VYSVSYKKQELLTLLGHQGFTPGFFFCKSSIKMLWTKFYNSIKMRFNRRTSLFIFNNHYICWIFEKWKINVKGQSRDACNIIFMELLHCEYFIASVPRVTLWIQNSYPGKMNGERHIQYIIWITQTIPLYTSHFCQADALCL
jgi:hypothetical protein